MLDSIFQEVQENLKKGTKSNKHPFRYCTLATVENGQPFQRTVVLREVKNDTTLWIYTDKRSKKVTQLKTNPTASLLFYHPKKMLQLSLQGIVEVKTDDIEVRKVWNSIQGKSRNDYSTVQPPSTEIKNPDMVSYQYDQENFTVLEFSISAIEYLQLKRPHHIRSLFVLENEQWSSTFLVP